MCKLNKNRNNKQSTKHHYQYNVMCKRNKTQKQNTKIYQFMRKLRKIIQTPKIKTHTTKCI